MRFVLLVHLPVNLNTVLSLLVLVSVLRSSCALPWPQLLLAVVEFVDLSFRFSDGPSTDTLKSPISGISSLNRRTKARPPCPSAL